MSWVFPFIVLLGALIFFHELGHFLVAKFYRVGVEKFSIGFGPRLFSRKYGETEYIIALLPLGGYVKMVGEDPFEEVNLIDQERSFSHKPLFQRFMIVLAGPVANFILALFIYMGLYLAGIPNLLPVVGDVAENSPAAIVGLQTGDQILKIGDQPISWWEEIPRIIQRSANKPLELQIDREGSVFSTTITPKPVDPKHPEGPGMIGIGNMLLLSRIGVPNTDSPAYRAGLRTGDEVFEIGDKAIEYFYQIEKIVHHSANQTLSFKIRRQVKNAQSETTIEDEPAFETHQFSVPVESVTDKDGSLKGSIGIDHLELYVLGVDSDKPAGKADIRVNDKIVSINGKAISSFTEYSDIVQKSEGKPFQIGLIRNEERLEKEVTPVVASVRKGPLKIRQDTFVLGIFLPSALYNSKRAEEQYFNPLTVFWKGLQKTGIDIAMTVGTFWYLIQREVSLDTLGGPIVIAKISGVSYQQGIIPYLLMMALISVNLGVINLLPIPILDGGHILMFGIEGVKGKQISIRMREIAMQIGFLFLVLLMGYVFYNDISRFWGDITDFFQN